MQIKLNGETYIYGKSYYAMNIMRLYLVALINLTTQQKQHFNTSIEYAW